MQEEASKKVELESKMLTLLKQQEHDADQDEAAVNELRRQLIDAQTHTAEEEKARLEQVRGAQHTHAQTLYTRTNTSHTHTHFTLTRAHTPTLTCVTLHSFVSLHHRWK